MNLPVDVELELLACGVADPHRPRLGEAREPAELELVEAPLPCDPVHDLEVGRVARDRAQEPVAPGLGLVPVAGVQHGQQRQRRVAEPAVAVVPVAHPADVLGEGGGRRRHDPARGSVGEGLQDEQGLVDLIVVVAVVPALPRPVEPVALGVGQRVLGVDRLGDLLVRRKPREDEGDPLARRELELGDRAHVLAAHVDLGPEAESVRPGHGDPGVIDAPHPRNRPAVVEADHELRTHRDTAVQPFDDPHDVGRRPARRHEVDRAHRAFGGRVDGLEDECVVAVAPCGPLDVRLWREEPAPVVRVAHQRREARARVEAREAAPVDRARAADQGGGLEVADQRVVLDPHARTLRLGACVGCRPRNRLGGTIGISFTRETSFHFTAAG